MNKKRVLIPTNTIREDCIQTPVSLARKIVEHFNPEGKILEPCKGNGNFMKVLPKETEWCEILEGRDFFNYRSRVNWIITNPPYSKLRKFMQKAMNVADDIVFLTTINHLWLRARLRDIAKQGFGIKEIVMFDTPKNFPQTGFQLGMFHLQRGYTKNSIKFEDWRALTSQQCLEGS